MADIAIRKHPHGGYLLQGEGLIHRPLDEVFAFFADAANLEVLTPPWLNFKIHTPQPFDMRPGCLIDYRLRVRGVPICWQSEITEWEPPHRFVDEARRGPYKYWRHEHRFEPCDGGTRVFDEVHYGVPGGALIHWLIVGRDVRKIFAYRHHVLVKLFPADQRKPALAAR